MDGWAGSAGTDPVPVRAENSNLRMMHILIYYEMGGLRERPFSLFAQESSVSVV